MATRVPGVDTDRLRAVLSRLSDEEREALIGLVTTLVFKVITDLGLAPERTSTSVCGAPAETTEAVTGAPAAGRRASFDGVVLVERDVVEAFDAGVSCLAIARGTVVSPLARDTARERGLSIEALEG